MCIRDSSPTEVRRAAAAVGFDEEQLRQYAYKPLDVRWLYWEPTGGLLDRGRPEYVPHVDGLARWLEVRQREPKESFDRGNVCTVLADQMGNGMSSFFPETLSSQEGTLDDPGERRPNLSPGGARFLGTRPVSALFSHAVAVLHAPGYRQANRAALVSDWPRIPLPGTNRALDASATLGAAVATLLDPLALFSGGPPVGTLSATSGTLDPSKDLAVTARWGIAGKGGITMPSTGRLTERPYTDDERKAIAGHAVTLGMSGEQAVELLGEMCFDVYLNNVAYWRCVPANVWRYTIGGYQVIKKWLSYRERRVLGRDLRREEARHVTAMVRRIAGIVLLQPRLPFLEGTD